MRSTSDARLSIPDWGKNCTMELGSNVLICVLPASTKTLMGQGSIKEIFTSLLNTWLEYLALQISIIFSGSRGYPFPPE